MTDGRPAIRDDRVHRLRACAGRETPSRLFAASTQDKIDHRARFPQEVGAVEASLTTLGSGLTYLHSSYHATTEEAILAIRSDREAFKFCVNFSDRATAKYTEGLPTSLHFPGEVQLQPLTVVAELVQPGTRASFGCLFTTGGFMQELVEELRLPHGAGPASRPSAREPWVMSTPLPPEVSRALSLMETCPLHGRLRELYMEGKALEVVSSLLARMCLGGEGPGQPARMRPREVRKIHEAHDIVRSRLDDLPSLRELAAAVGMSTSSFKNAWRAVFGMPVFEYAREERLTCARTLLAQGDLSVSEVADRVGYRSLSWFSAAFKRQFGVLPREVWPRTVKELPSTDNAAY